MSDQDKAASVFVQNLTDEERDHMRRALDAHASASGSASEPSPDFAPPPPPPPVGMMGRGPTTPNRSFAENMPSLTPVPPTPRNDTPPNDPPPAHLSGLAVTPAFAAASAAAPPAAVAGADGGCAHAHTQMMRMIDREPLDVLWCQDCGALGPISSAPNMPRVHSTLMQWALPKNARK